MVCFAVEALFKIKQIKGNEKENRSWQHIIIHPSAKCTTFSFRLFIYLKIIHKPSN